MISFLNTTECHAGCLTKRVRGVSFPSTDKASYSNIKEQLQVEWFSEFKARWFQYEALWAKPKGP